MNRTTRRITAAIAGPLAAVGIALGGVALGQSAPASAQPTTGCSSMTMPQTSAGANGPSALTRAGQLSAASAPASSGGQTAMTCPTVGHG